MALGRRQRKPTAASHRPRPGEPYQQWKMVKVHWWWQGQQAQGSKASRVNRAQGGKASRASSKNRVEDQSAGRVSRVQADAQNGRDGGKIGRWGELKRKQSLTLLRHRAGITKLGIAWIKMGSYQTTGVIQMTMAQEVPGLPSLSNGGHLIFCFTTSLRNGNSGLYYYYNSRTTCTVLLKKSFKNVCLLKTVDQFTFRIDNVYVLQINFTFYNFQRLISI